MTTPPASYLLFDGECPACRAYVAFARLREMLPGLAVLDARAHPKLVADLRRRGYEINTGMVLVDRGQLYFGSEVTELIAGLARDQSRRRRLVLALFGAPGWARRVYPALNTGRRLLLRLKGVGPVR